MSVIFEGIEMPTACCFVDGEHSAFAHFEYCKFYNICEKRDTIKTNCKPSDCPVKVLKQEPRKGHWIKVHPLQENDEGDYMCSECKCGGLVWKPTTYCPNCGSRNEVEE